MTMETEHREHEEALRMRINQAVDAYFAQQPRPPLDAVVDYFGLDVVHVDRRRGARTLHVPDLKAALFEYCLREETGDALIFPEYLDETITPTDPGERPEAGSGTGIERGEDIPRTTYLVELLGELGIAFDAPFVGKVRTQIRGKQSYFFFYLPEKRIGINVCNGSANASFLFYDVPERNVIRDRLVPLSKTAYTNTAQNPYAFHAIAWTGEEETWKEKIQQALLYAPEAHIRDGEQFIALNEDPEDARVKVKSLGAVTYMFALAHRAWKVADDKQKFNGAWMRRNGYFGAIQWAQQNAEAKRLGGLVYLLKQVDTTIRNDFDYKPKRTLESTKAEMRAAHAAWKALDEDARPPFTITWLQKNYNGLEQAIRKRFGGVEAFLTAHVLEIKADLEIRVKRTLKTVQDELRGIHAAWVALPAKDRGLFNTRFLQQKHPDLERWLRRHHGEVGAFLRAHVPAVVSDFSELHMRTVESAQSELVDAFRAWQGDAEATSFNARWLIQNYKNLHSWIIANYGTVVAFVQAQGSDEIQAAFSRDNMGDYDSEEKVLARLRELKDELGESLSMEVLRKRRYHALVGRIVELGGWTNIKDKL